MSSEPTRFVRILPDPDPKADPGVRLRVDYDPDDTGVFMLYDEKVLPEKVLEPNCNRVTTLATIPLTHNTAQWLRDTFTDLMLHLGRGGKAGKE